MFNTYYFHVPESSWTSYWDTNLGHVIYWDIALGCFWNIPGKLKGALISGGCDHATTEIPEMQQEHTQAHQLTIYECVHSSSDATYVY